MRVNEHRKGECNVVVGQKTKFRMKKIPVICLMGPTASGKTPLAIKIVQHFPCEIISVDSAMIYRGMDIGTAKPSCEELQIAPHRLINIKDPHEAYSAGEFRNDVLREIDAITAQNKIPLLVGGTMLYFRVLQQGIADLPTADQTMRDKIQQQADVEGWLALYRELQRVDPVAALRIHENDSQRIARALEVYYVSGKTLSDWLQQETPLPNHLALWNIGLMPDNRAQLHDNIAQRFDLMLARGFLNEVKTLYLRGDLTKDLPSIRAVGYRQIWAHLAGEIDFTTMREQAIAATRQLAKRQMTWLRTWPELMTIKSDDENVWDEVAKVVEKVVE